MARQYSARTFLRKTPNELLRRYFEQRDLDLGLEWDTLGETDVEPIFEALDRLPEARQQQVESDFRMVNDLACEAGTLAILEEARFWNRDWSDAFAKMRNAYERSMWTFLNEPQRFRVAGNFHEMDRRRGWRRRFVGHRLRARSDEAALEALATGLRDYYRRQARGRYCHVDCYLRREPERHCYFAYPEDYASTDLGYDEHGRFQQRARRSAFEIIFVYRPEDGMLEVRARGTRDQVAELERIFCTTILGLQDLPDDSGRVPYDLSVLRDAEFAFPTEPEDRITAVHVRQLRLDLPGPASRRVTLSARTGPHAPRVVHELLESVLDGTGHRIDEVHISQVRLRLTFAPLNGERPRSLTFEVTYPDRCTLKDDPLDQIARRCLKRWGIARD